MRRGLQASAIGVAERACSWELKQRTTSWPRVSVQHRPIAPARPHSRRLSPPRRQAPLKPGQAAPRRLISPRSEEHTSELQSLMRISYAVFCLKKKKQYDMNELLQIHYKKPRYTQT